MFLPICDSSSDSSSGSNPKNVLSHCIVMMCCRAGQVTSTEKPLKLTLLRSPGKSPEATAAAEKAASTEASANADPKNASAYGRSALSAVDTELVGRVTVASAASLPQVWPPKICPGTQSSLSVFAVAISKLLLVRHHNEGLHLKTVLEVSACQLHCQSCKKAIFLCSTHWQ